MLFNLNLFLNLRNFCLKFDELKLIKWRINSIAHTIQKDNINCGVYCCIYLEKLCKNNNDLFLMNEEANMFLQRERINCILLKKSVISSYYCKYCGIGDPLKNLKNPLTKCIKCSNNYHEKCHRNNLAKIFNLCLNCV